MSDLYPEPLEGELSAMVREVVWQTTLDDPCTRCDLFAGEPLCDQCLLVIERDRLLNELWWMLEHDEFAEHFQSWLNEWQSHGMRIDQFTPDWGDVVKRWTNDIVEYHTYVVACVGELCEPHSKGMWRVHGRPNHPLGFIADDAHLDDVQYEISGDE